MASGWLFELPRPSGVARSDLTSAGTMVDKSRDRQMLHLDSEYQGRGAIHKLHQVRLSTMGE